MNKSEEVVSMFLGLGIVVLISFLLVSYFRKNLAGKVDVPGISDQAVVLTASPSVTKTVSINKDKVIKKKQPVDLKAGEYRVVYGDSLSKIAKKFYGKGDKWTLIAKANNINKPSLLEVGQVLKIEKIESTTIGMEKKDSITGSGYKIARGDTLAKIALRAYGDSFAWTKIWKANKYISNPNLIHTDNVLVIPRS